MKYPTITLQGLTEIQPHRFEGEASDLGLPPGHWPYKLETTIGNGLPLALEATQKLGEEIIAVRYTQAAGCVTVTIFND